MKTNNVDFGKSFKFKTHCQEHDLIYTCNAVDDKGECVISWDWGKGEGTESTEYDSSSVKKYIKEGSWIVLPTDMREIVGDIGPELSFQTNTKITDNLLNEIKSFTTTSKHSVNIYNGTYEVFRSGEDMAYQCKDDETLKSVMQALSVLDKVTDE